MPSHTHLRSPHPHPPLTLNPQRQTETERPWAILLLKIEKVTLTGFVLKIKAKGIALISTTTNPLVADSWHTTVGWLLA